MENKETKEMEVILLSKVIDFNMKMDKQDKLNNPIKMFLQKSCKAFDDGHKKFYKLTEVE